MYRFLMAFTGVISVSSAYAIYKLGLLHFIPVWNGGVEDKTFISLGLLICLAIFLVALEHFLTLVIGSIMRNLRSPTLVNFSLLTTIIKAVLFPFKFIVYFFSLAVSTKMLSLELGIFAAIIVGCIYFFGIPSLNKIINGKIAGGFINEKTNN